MSIDGVRRLMELMAEKNPTTLYSPDRYALQIVVPAATAEQALSDALATWKDSQRRLNLSGWQLARAEVITAAEFERDTDRRRRELASVPQDAEKDLEDDLLRQAFHDPTTGLAGRALFLNHLRHELARTERIDGQLALVLLELGSIEVPEDGLDEDFRNAILTAVADRLTEITRGRDSVARVGDSRFAVLLEEVGEQAVVDVADRLISAVASPVSVGSYQAVLPVAAGVTTSERGDTAETLILTAEMALRRSDRTGSTVR